MKNERNERELLTIREIIALFLLLLFASAIMTNFGHAEAEESAGFDFENETYEGVVILDDPIYFMDLEEEEYATPSDMEPAELEKDAQTEPIATESPKDNDMNGAMIDETDVHERQEQEVLDTNDEQEPVDTDVPVDDELNEATTAAPALSTDEEHPPEATVSPTEEPTVKPDPTSTPKPRSRKKKEPTLYDVPQALLDADPAFAAIMQEASKYVGYPYVWGGSNPRTSFDCSGFVSWVYTQSGVSNTGRKGATGLYKLCTEVSPEEARPGDLVFFKGTMGPDVPGVTHVGIYVGNNWMLHCGDPIGYADLTEERWVKRFFTYGRLTYEGVYANDQSD